MSESADIVVAGAGHNSLVTAAYLTKAGYECLVLDTRPIAGGGAATEELFGPGYKIDSCSTGHTLIRVNPLLSMDELGLHADYGLEYIEPDPVAHVAFPDGEHFTQWLDLERTCEEIARFSKRDVEAYRQMIAEYDEVKVIYGLSRLMPHGYGASLEELLLKHPRGRIWLRRNNLTAWDIIQRVFESEHVRAFMAWQAFQTGVPLDAAGSGTNAYSIVLARQTRSWSIPRGGSGSLTQALVRYLEDNGSTVVCNRRVTELILEDGRCVGVETEDGEQWLGRKAVLSTIHVKHLVDMAPKEAWGEEFLYGVDTYDVGGSGMAAYFATTAPPEFETSEGPRTAVSAGTVDWPQEVIDFHRAVRDGKPYEKTPWLLMATPTLVDPDRAPPGHHTVKVLSGVSKHLPDGYSDWDQYKEVLADRQLEKLRQYVPNLAEEYILERYVKSPEDFERANPHMIDGTFHGGDRSIAFSGSSRPVPGWADHRMPIPGLYQTGGTTSVGGSITGVPGRSAAVVMLDDLGENWAEVITGGGRARAGSH